MEPTGTSDADGTDGTDGTDRPAAAGAAGDGGVPVVTDNAARSRYELRVGDEVAGFVTYRLAGQLIDLLHTEVAEKFQGTGLASPLAQGALDDARARHLTVKPTCPYIRSWIRKHPDYADLAQRPEAS